jgi:hypothetical protein
MDSFWCLKEIHSICYCFTHIHAWKAHARIWVFMGKKFVVEGQKHAHWSTNLTIVVGRSQKPCMMLSSWKQYLLFQMLIMLLLVQMKWPLLMFNNGSTSMHMWWKIGNKFQFC